MRILWASNAPWAPSGYGGQTLQVVKRLVADGHDVAIAANFGIQAMSITHDALPGVPILPALYDGIGNDILPAHYEMWRQHDGEQPTQLITLYDVWPYHRPAFESIPVASWTPVDHYPVPPQVADWCRDHDTIAMSRYGQERFRDAGIESTYIPHAIETADYRPIDGARETLGWDPDAFYILINAANKGAVMRKGWGEMFGAVAMMMAAYPDVRLHLHTERVGANAPDLGWLVEAWRLDGDRVTWAPQYQLKTGAISPYDLATMYSASDVLLATSKGEGFGIPVIEAQACGLPVIVSNWTAQPELCGAGWIADVQPDVDPVQRAFWATPIISSIQSKLAAAHARRGDRTLREEAIRFAHGYDADRVYAEHWRPYLAALEDKLTAKPTRRERRQRRKLVAVK